MDGNLHDLIEDLHQGNTRATDVAKAFLDRIDQYDKDLHAFAFCSRDQVLEEAEKRDQQRRRQRALGALHGVPVAIKDIISVKGMPLEYGSSLFKGQLARDDAFLVSRLKEAGAVIIGKTTTTPFANLDPSPARNPHNHSHTPGGSSSGSAVAIAAGMASLALGTQTNGSVIRPASFCGVFGYKPSHGSVSCHGILPVAPNLDTPGVFARALEDCAILADVLFGHDPRDSMMSFDTRMEVSRCYKATPPHVPRLAFVSEPAWDAVDEATKDLFRHALEHIGVQLDFLRLPEIFNDALACLKTIMEAELAHHTAPFIGDRLSRISDKLAESIKRGQAISAVQYQQALRKQRQLRHQLRHMMIDDYDALLTPASLGEAPADLTTTGDPCFNSIWTLCGAPAISLPLLRGRLHLPIGLQMVSYHGDDCRLFRNARWLCDKFEHELHLTTPS